MHLPLSAASQPGFRCPFPFFPRARILKMNDRIWVTVRVSFEQIKKISLYMRIEFMILAPFNTVVLNEMILSHIQIYTQNFQTFQNFLILM